VQDPHDEGGRGVEEPEVCFRLEEVRLRGWSGRPEERVVVGEEGEEDAEEEGRCCAAVSGVDGCGRERGLGGGGKEMGSLRQTIRKVAKAKVGMMPNSTCQASGRY
jgi:hypothetical protein